MPVQQPARNAEAARRFRQIAAALVDDAADRLPCVLIEGRCRARVAYCWHLAAALCCNAPALAQTEPAREPGRVEIIGTSPLAGLGVERELLPYASQVLRRGAIDQAQAGPATELLTRRLPGAQVNEIQGSAYQPDLTFRGYRASGLLGASQGLSVYLDGVRVNEPFGDVVNWDLLPEFALQSLSVVPGANPAFGLNTLGGAIALTTLDGRSAPGARGEIGFGSFGGKRADLSFGARSGEWNHFVAGSVFDEHGWRDHSPGRLGTLSARVGQSLAADSEWSIAALIGRSMLVGNGLVPQVTLDDTGQRTPDLLQASRKAVYTHPDRTRNTLGQLAFNWSAGARDSRLQALAYARHTRRETVNGDVADEPGTVASLNTTNARQTAVGAAASLARRDGAHQWQAGASVDASRVRYRQFEREGGFDATRGVVADPAEQAELSAAVEGESLSLGLYVTDTWRVAAATHVTLTARTNHSRVSNELTTVDDVTGNEVELPRETFTYSSLNPAVGVTRGLGFGVTVYGNVARNTRVPTAIELGCADPASPCRLPAGLQSDPFLKQVHSTAFELGARWRPADAQRVELTAYRHDNRDDIVFGSVSATGQLGYFQNFPRTRHEGLDLAWEGTFGPASVGASASLLRATYQAAGTLRMGERNVAVEPGTRMAGLPRSMLKVGGDWRFAPGWSAGVDWSWHGRRVVQGNEDGLLEDGAADSVDLSLPGYALTHLRLAWQVREGVELTLRVNNGLDKRYATYGALAETLFDAQGAYTGAGEEALFVAPGAPRSVFLAARLRF